MCIAVNLGCRAPKRLYTVSRHLVTQFLVLAAQNAKRLRKDTACLDGTSFARKNRRKFQVGSFPHMCSCPVSKYPPTPWLAAKVPAVTNGAFGLPPS